MTLKGLLPKPLPRAGRCTKKTLVRGLFSPRVILGGSEVVGLRTLELSGLVSLLKYFIFLSLRSLPFAFRNNCFSLGENHIPQSVYAKISVGKGEEWAIGLERMLSREGSESPGSRGHLHHGIERSRQIRALGGSVR